MNRADDRATNIAQTAIFLWQGFMDVIAPGGNNKGLTEAQTTAYDAHFDGLGQDGMAMTMGLIALAIEDEYAAKWSSPTSDFPGVYHYEVIEPLGSWLATQVDLVRSMQYADPSSDTIKDEYNERMAAWLVTARLTQ